MTTGIYDIYKAKKIGLAPDFWTYLLGRKLRKNKQPVPTEFFILNVSKLGIGKLK